VNGKPRGRAAVEDGLDGAEVERLALSRPDVVAALGGKAPVRVVFAGNIVNIVTR
jgi:hypothetical protein